jgi:hypothetical protein
LGRNRRTVAKFLGKPETRQVVDIQREELAGMFDQVAHWTLAAVPAKDIEKANLVQIMTSAGVAIDKAAMQRNELPAAINDMVLMDSAPVSC